MKGPNPTPTAIRILRGNPGRRALPKDEPKPEAARSLDPPAWLDDAARAEWIDKAGMLDRLGLLTEADLDAFAV